MLLEHLGKVVKKDRREKLVAHVFAYNELANCKVFSAWDSLKYILVFSS